MGFCPGEPQGVPRGGIMLWYGSLASIPNGWALCNGANGTPDLRNKFVIGANIDTGGIPTSSIEGGNAHSGGWVSHQHAVDIPSHSHDINTSEFSHSGIGSVFGNSDSTEESNEIPTDTSEQDHIPPYVALAYIMKL